ncbi:hypothetical protein HZC07_01745, partial [Candidatus Micrarchaeota archaeon]|nr:hypothetical protein [Candidatus Micrarchaeota archaeon]
MDAITALAASIDSPIIRSLSMLFDNDIIYAAVLVILLAIGEKRTEKRLKVICCMMVAFLVSGMLKGAIAENRPCYGQTGC